MAPKPSIEKVPISTIFLVFNLARFTSTFKSQPALKTLETSIVYNGARASTGLATAL
jgi:hypothetical protein